MLRLIPFVLLAACASSDLSGDWTGAWSGGNTAGTLTESLSQDGSHVTGRAMFTSSPCWNIADLDLVVDDVHLSGTATSGGVAVIVSATFDDAHIEGTFTVPTGPCAGTGSYTLDR